MRDPPRGRIGVAGQPRSAGLPDDLIILFGQGKQESGGIFDSAPRQLDRRFRCLQAFLDYQIGSLCTNIHKKTFQAHIAAAAAWLDSKGFALGPNLIALCAETGEEVGKAACPQKRGVHIGADRTAHSRAAVLLCVPFGIMPALVLRLNDG